MNKDEREVAVRTIAMWKERAEKAEAELAELKAVLQNPKAVHVNILRGTIALRPEDAHHIGIGACPVPVISNNHEKSTPPPAPRCPECGNFAQKFDGRQWHCDDFLCSGDVIDPDNRTGSEGE